MSTRPLSYEPFFGLRQKPFSLAPDPEFLYESPTHATALNGLLAGIRRREGLLALTGDVGTGKTTICRALLRSLDQTTFSAFIPDPFASREDLLKMLLIDFGVVKIQDFTTGPLANARRTELSYLLSSFLETLVPLDAFVVVFIDEAQKMSPSLIEEVRILSDNFCRHGQLQIVFVGQLELMDTLKSPNLRHVDQRVCVYCKLEPLSLGDVAGYINHRLQVAGGTPGHPMFAPGALALIHEAACGVPRLMNRLCDRALHEAFRLRLPIVDRELLQSVLDDGPARVAAAAPAAALPVPAPKPIAVPQPFAGASPFAVAQRPAVVRPQTDAPPPATSPAAAAPSRPSAMPAAAPRATGAAFATQVDAWLAELDTGPASVAAIPPLEEPAWAEETPPSAPAPGVGVEDKRDVVRRPYRYIERIGRRWARAAVLVTAALVGLKVLSAAANYMPVQSAGPSATTAVPMLPATPLPDMRPVLLSTPAEPERPDAAVSGPSVVAVAVFATVDRAERLREALEQQGFQGLTRVFVRDGQAFYRVLLGPFDSAQAATASLLRLQQDGEFADARVMAQ
jgi:type II secretory pathway predicted ATPase ExeA/cell division septation protein DedD